MSEIKEALVVKAGEELKEGDAVFVKDGIAYRSAAAAVHQLPALPLYVLDKMARQALKMFESHKTIQAGLLAVEIQFGIPDYMANALISRGRSLREKYGY